jgi:hypothetical protein
MNTTGRRTVVVRNLHNDLEILTSFLRVELIHGSIITTDFAVITGLEVVHQCITQHQSPLANIQLDGVASILLSNVVCEGGGHGSFPLYECIIGHPERVSGCIGTLRQVVHIPNFIVIFFFTTFDHRVNNQPRKRMKIFFLKF